VLEQVQVAETMDRDVPVIVAETQIRELAERIARHDPGVSRHQALWIVDGTGQLEGVITRGDVMRAFERDHNGAMTVLEAGARDPVVTYPDEALGTAAARMLAHDVGRRWNAGIRGSWWVTWDGAG